MSPDGTSGPIRVRLFAGAADAVGAAELELAGVTDAGELVSGLADGREPRVRAVLDQCSLLADGVRLAGPSAPIKPGSTVDVLPPFAGG